jgi:hypothetical protein
MLLYQMQVRYAKYLLVSHTTSGRAPTRNLTQGPENSTAAATTTRQRWRQYLPWDEQKEPLLGYNWTTAHGADPLLDRTVM